MFIHDCKLDHLLTPAYYCSAQFFEKERAQLFSKTWQYVGLTQDLARDGDYVSTELLGVPVLVRNVGGTLRAFKNVCAHRHSTIVAPGHGNEPRIKCMYHGWEYGPDGQVSK